MLWLCQSLIFLLFTFKLVPIDHVVRSEVSAASFASSLAAYPTKAATTAWSAHIVTLHLSGIRTMFSQVIGGSAAKAFHWLSIGTNGVAFTAFELA